MKKSFTINCNRSKDEIESYGRYLLNEGIYQACEIFYPDPNNIEQTTRYINNISELKSKYPNTEFVFHLPFGKDHNLGNAEQSKTCLSKFIKAIDYAKEFEVQKMTLHPGAASSMGTRDIEKEIAINNIRILAKYARRFNMTIMLENLVSDLEFMISNKEIIEYLSRLSEEKVQFTLDFGHAAVRNLDIEELILQVGDRLHHTHIHDNHHNKDEHLPPLEGNIDFKLPFRLLKKMNYTHLFGLEALYKDYNDLLKNAEIIDEIYKGA